MQPGRLDVQGEKDVLLICQSHPDKTAYAGYDQDAEKKVKPNTLKGALKV